ncbi:hypothetical protein P154DRAFT_520128 [Amniculicola lignicola CBS 123094]|uniref:Zn(2)-C6 fungal-type domain-containing protein n=1 Tax=Amniculicola lignicola CBS 123094 TaxID=1392246 RepID=A0A6A5WPC0_9PLEO|nr:hypothetical protein P154DRAFT_520128 [Amniculicola lignicola CBS 123094]
MPRPKKPGAGEPKRRSRNGCWPCKARKVKCGEEKPRCTNCERQGESCDYSIRLNWGGRTKRDKSDSGTSSATNSPHSSVFSFEDSLSPLFPPPTPNSPVPPTSFPHHARSRSAVTSPNPGSSIIDPELARISQAQAQSILAMGGPFGQLPNFNLQDSSRRSLQPTSSPYDSRQESAMYSQSMEFSPSTTTNFDMSGLGLDLEVHNRAMKLEPPLSPPAMPPPTRGPSSNLQPPRQYTDIGDALHQRHKRSHSAESPAPSGSGGYASSLSASEAYSPNPGPLTPFSPYAMPLTPVSSVGSEDVIMRNAPKTAGASSYQPPELRRLSVQSLLASPSEESPCATSPESHHSRHYPMGDSSTITYGYDLGYPDLDIPKNDDVNAIQRHSPEADVMEYDDDGGLYGNAEVRGKDIAFEKGGYYAKPVPIKIPKHLEPLPQLLLDNPMNLIYFHHFLNHTARILVPHDCEQNPFRQILPEMAVKDENILNLLLAFSASHRARLLNHPEPANRIAVWVEDVFPKLRQALANNNNQVSHDTLAPAIMMASLEIISPNTFEVPISWQNHLTIARQMIIARGGPGNIDRHDRVAYFLSRWFAYLDVLGSLSGNKNDEPLGSFYWSSENASADEDFQIDCLLGFTTRCVGILAHIAELAKKCEPQRIDADGNIREDWRPEPFIVAQGERLRLQLEEGLSDHVVYKGCNHRSSDSSESEGAWDATEIYATNEMFHWAGLIHLHRRVLGKATNDPAVQMAVRMISGLLFKVRRGSTAEACLLFPMFTAGCDAIDEGQREKIMERLRSLEGFGMTQVHRARSLMQKVWDTGKPWESLVTGEFFG